MRKIQTYLYYLLFFITPFAMYSGTSELFEFNKMIFIYILTSGILCVWIMRMMQKGRVEIKRTPFDIFVWLFFISQVASTIFSIDAHTSIFGYYGRFNGGLLSLVTYLVLYYSFITFLDEERKEGEQCIERILQLSIWSSFFVILWGVPGKMGHDLSCLVFSGKFDNACWTAQFDPASRMFSTLGQPNWMGAYVAIIFFITIYYYFKNKGTYFWYGFLLALNLIAVFFTNSRSSVMSVLLTLIPLIGFILFKARTFNIPFLRRKLIMLGIYTMLLIIIFKTGVGQIDRFLKIETYPQLLTPKNKIESGPVGPSAKPNPNFNVTSSVDIRKIVWKGAVNLGLQYRLFGTGVETFAYSYYFVRPVEHNLTSEWDYLYNKAHNEYLNFFATTGFFGLGTYSLLIVIILFLALIWIKKSPSLIQICLLAAWLTILITNFVGFSTTTINLYFFIIPVIMYFFELLKNQSKEIPFKNVQNRGQNQGMSPVWYVVIILLFIFLLQYFVSYWMADTSYALGENYAKSGDYQTAVTLITKAQQLHPEHVYKDKLSFYIANLAIAQKDPSSLQEMIKLSDDYNTQSLKESPQNILYWKTRIKNEYIFFQITLDKRFVTEGINALTEAQRLSPTDPKLPYFEATYYAVLSDEEKNIALKKQYEEKSLSAINRSIGLKKDYYDSYYLKAQLLKKYQMKSEAKQVYEYILKYVSPDNKQVLDELKSL